MRGTADEDAALLTRLIGEFPAAVALFDLRRRYVAASPSWIAAFALPRDFAGRRHDELQTGGDAVLEEAQRRALAGAPVEGLRGPAGDPRQPAGSAIYSAHPHRAAGGAVAGALVASSREQMPIREDPKADQDALTGLAGRGQFALRLRQALADAEAAGAAVTALALDINRFRAVNLLHGGDIGDRALCVVAERLLAGIRSTRPDEAQGEDGQSGGDMLARLGGNEFGVLCGAPGLSSAQAQALAGRLLQLTQQPVVLDEVMLSLTASIGILTATPAHRDADDLLRDLDLALRRAKASGPGRVSLWDSRLTRDAVRRASLADQLRRGFAESEFVLHYQPVVELRNGRIVGAEVLLRWRRPSDGLVGPASFLPVLEETDLIVDVGRWTIHRATRQLEEWRALYGRDIVEWLSVNLSPRQLDNPEALLSALREVHDGGLAARRLKLEIAEATLMRDSDATRDVLAEIARLGFRVAIDDFGRGHAAPSTLRRFAVEMIKIDAELVQQIGAVHGDELVRTLISLARMQGATIVAEGVETAAQRDFLAAHGCGLGQGYLFGEPVEGAALGSQALTGAAGGSASQGNHNSSAG